MNPNLSRTERANLLVFAGFISALSLIDLFGTTIHDLIHPSNTKIISFHEGPADHFLLGRLLGVGVFFVVLFTKRRFIPSLICALLSAIPFLVRFGDLYHNLTHDADVLYTRTAFSILFLVANPLDYLIPVLLILLVLWLLSIILRPYVKPESGNIE